MRAHRLLMGWVIVAGVVGVCASCTQSKPTAGPGQLPARDSNDSTPVKISATTYFAHGHLLERSGSLEAAVEQYRKALEAQPDFLTARNRLGITLNALGRNAEATAEFRRALAVNPGQAHLHNNLAFSLYSEGKTAEAEAAARRALELKPDFARARMNLGLILAKQDRYDEALGEFRQGVGEADAYYNLALVQSESGRFTEAVRSLDQALRIDPGNELARQHLHQIADRAAQQDAGMTPAPYANATRVSPAPSPVDAAYASSGSDTPREMLSPVDMSSSSSSSSDSASSAASSDPTLSGWSSDSASSSASPGTGSTSFASGARSAGSTSATTGSSSSAGGATHSTPPPTLGGFDETGVNHAFITPNAADPHTPTPHTWSIDTTPASASASDTGNGIAQTPDAHASQSATGRDTHANAAGSQSASGDTHASAADLQRASGDPTATGDMRTSSGNVQASAGNMHASPTDTHTAPPAIVPVGSSERSRAAAAGFRALAITAQAWCFEGFFWQQCFAILAVQAEANLYQGGVPGSAAESLTHGVQ